LCFFFLTVVLVLQLLPVGRAIIADRYTYLPYVGVGLAIGSTWKLHHRSSGAVRFASLVILVAFGAALGWGTYRRCAMWRDNVSLWTDVLRQYPDVSTAHNNLALTYREEGRIDLAMAHLTRALAINPRDEEALCNRGNCLF